MKNNICFKRKNLNALGRYCGIGWWGAGIGGVGVLWIWSIGGDGNLSVQNDLEYRGGWKPIWSIGGVGVLWIGSIGCSPALNYIPSRAR